MKWALIHRYNDARDVGAVQEFKCSDVPGPALGDSFEIVIVTPPYAERRVPAVWADAVSEQEEIKPPLLPLRWPADDRSYEIRVRLANLRLTTYEKVREAVKAAGEEWRAQWPRKVVRIDETRL